MEKLIVITLSAIMLIASVSCKTKQQARAYDGVVSTENYRGDVDKFIEPRKLFEENQSMTNENQRVQKIIYSANLSLAVDEPVLVNEKLKEIASTNGGYVSVLGTYRSVIRVKSGKMNDAITELEALGKVKSKNMYGKDVSDQYRDYQIRLENAEKARDRYLELLSKAENVEAALKVEVELERLNETIELLKGKIQSMDHLSEYSTITVYITERKKPGIIGFIGLGLYHSVKWLFVRN